ncbi:DAK2 domain-containing protein [Couchioplanes azureus]|uniref:DAK2 domain-containing protein n=1 Tax=Couchioplanes caeruleus TaxID=56438 RepID=UPI0016711C9E|nr:DAK2 domain-containing protein [Couchioplanes caeruleus]GGQ37931.1 dihydroxyacetone kinase [Couchioplanes caeruleus subsp. azureus]
MLETLDAAAVHRWCGAGLAALRAHQHEIDELNVYPVPDGDTGTNLVLTLASAQEALAGSPATEAEDTVRSGLDGGPLGQVMRRMARGALLGARGNSGVIVSQILRGMADTFASAVSVRGAELAAALRTASEAAYAAVARPVEGTVLSVAAAAAEGAGKIKSDDLLAVARAAARAAAEALARTPQQLPVLADAGVVDAGGRGLVLLLDALVEALSSTAADGTQADPVPPPPAAAPPAGGPPAGGFGYEVQFLLDAEPAAVEVMKRTLDGLGDSLVVVGTGEGRPPTWNVHVHVADIGAAIEAGIVAGRPHRISVNPLEDRVHDHGHPHPAPAHPAAGAEAAAAAAEGDRTVLEEHAETGGWETGDRGAVVVAAGEGLTSLFADEGTVVVGRNPSTAEMLAAVAQTGARRVVLLPNDANTHAVAVSAAQEAAAAGIRVVVVPTRSPVQALAALAVRDSQRRFDDDVIAMAEAAGACRYGEVTTAAREALTVAGRCHPGDLLGLVDGEVNVISGGPEDGTASDAALADVSRRLLDRMLGGGGELVTLVLGADAPATLEEALRSHLAHAWPFVEVQCYTGGQPRYHLLAGVE